MKKRVAGCFLCVALVLGGCSNQEATEQSVVSLLESSSIETSDEESKVKYADDYEYLWGMLENSYPYLVYIDENIVNTKDLHDRYEVELTSIDKDADFANMIQRLFGEMEHFAHLEVITPEVYKALYSTFVLDEELSTNEYAAPTAELLKDPKLSDIYTVPQSYEEYAEREKSDELTAVYVNYYDDCNALYMRLPSFEHALVKRDKDIVYNALEQYPDTEHIIFDISANHGGDNTYWVDNIVAPFGGDHEFKLRAFYKSADSADPDVELLPTSELVDAPEWAANLGLNHYCNNNWSILEDNFDGKRIQGNYEFWVLTGPNTFSAAERFACFCKSTGWATLVGDKTSGDGLGRVAFTMLPDSGLLIQFNSAAGENPDGSINAVSGTAPDVSCNEKKHSVAPLSRCLELIRGQ
ncbi:S41 family peptidase [Butyrivibrio sp. AE3004]|uniref:S41 family peptidase n=1 Tax=Butyrivibrio sp. AE3004 TaxID=1506994 RepID=UPI0018CC323B|nr:S41 family peptidase [Butyrivibrio sp. AE3004]